MKIVSLGTLKGGVGKTMLVFQLSAILSLLEKKILIMDMDTQGNISNVVGYDRTQNQNQDTTASIFYLNSRPDPTQLIVKAPNKALPNIDIIPSSILMHKAESDIAVATARESYLQSYIETYPKVFNKYDYIFIDTNPSMSVINKNAFVVSDSILLTGDVSQNSLEGAQLFIALWNDVRPLLKIQSNIKGYIINNIDDRQLITKDGKNELFNTNDYEEIKDILIDTQIPTNVSIRNAEKEHLPVIIYDKDSKGALAFRDLMNELIEKSIL